MPRDEGRIGRLRTLFTDLSNRDINENVHLVCRIIRSGKMLSTDNEGKDNAPPSPNMSAKSPNAQPVRTGIRRPFGVAVIPLQQVFSNKTNTGVEFQMRVYLPTQEPNFVGLVDDIINGTAIQEKASASTATKSEGLVVVSLRTFKGEANTIVKENPGLLADAPITPRLGFPDVLLPVTCETRSTLR